MATTDDIGKEFGDLNGFVTRYVLKLDLQILGKEFTHEDRFAEQLGCHHAAAQKR